VRCLQCASELAFLPDRLALCAIEAAGPPGLWRRKPGRWRGPPGPPYRLCRNNTEHQACNFAVPQHDPNPLCVSCRQTRVLPDLSVPGNPERWARMEVAKRRLFYTLALMRLASTDPPGGTSDGPVFEFLADTPGRPVMTGHAAGVITLNIAEADDAERVRRKVELHEPYRTLLGHFRHESGHFYWDRLVDGTPRLAPFRELFGDERADYGEALQAYYGGGTPADWNERFVSAYASAHPWEDWAETWAHYLHMTDLLETAASYSTSLAVPGGDATEEVDDPFVHAADFDALVTQWVPLTLLLNSLNRSLGQEDAYPFALSVRALEKLRFVHDTILGPAQR